MEDVKSTGVSGQAFGAGNLIATVSAVGTNANGDRKQGDDGCARSASNQPKRVPQVTKKRIHNG